MNGNIKIFSINLPFKCGFFTTNFLFKVFVYYITMYLNSVITSRYLAIIILWSWFKVCCYYLNLLNGKIFPDVQRCISIQRYNKWFTIRTYVILLYHNKTALILIATGNKVWYSFHEVSVELNSMHWKLNSENLSLMF